MDGTINIWDVEAGECERSLHGQTTHVLSLAQADETRLASGSYDSNGNTIKMWNVDSGRCEMIYEDMQFYAPFYGARVLVKI